MATCPNYPGYAYTYPLVTYGSSAGGSSPTVEGNAAALSGGFVA